MKQKLLSLFFVLTCLIGLAYAQNRQVEGRITASTDGTPLGGVSVSVVGLSTSTQSDASGYYVITVPVGGTINYSYIGHMAQRVKFTNQSVIDIQLATEDNALEEVVITAMGVSTQKRALTNATQELKAEVLVQAANNNLATAIQGKVSGVEVTPSSGMPGASAKITIRGSRSFTGNNTPLYVVDGMPISSTADESTNNSVTGTDYATRGLDIDPNDIERINILKGQAASALYGMRASNGAIIITTKSGKGAEKGKAKITFNTNVAFDRVAVLPKLQSVYAQGVNATYNPTASGSWGPLIEKLNLDPIYGGDTDNVNTQRDGKKTGMYYVPQRAAAGLNPWVKPRRYSNIKNFLQTGATYTNSLNVLQGFEKGHYAFSLGSTNSKGIIPSMGLDRYNAKLAAEVKLTDNWKTGFTGNFVHSKLTKSTGANDGIVATLYPAPPSYDLKGIPSHFKNDPFKQNNYRAGAFDAAYWSVENNVFSESNQRFFGNGYTEYSTNFTENQKLTLRYQLGVDSYTTNYTDLFGYGHANGRGQVKNFHVSSTELNSLTTATYNLTEIPNLTVDVLVGNEVVDRQRRRDEDQGFNFNFSGWNTINNASIYLGKQSLRNYRSFGLFGNLAFGFKNMLFLNLTGRHDIVSAMPRNNRSFFYPSISAGFVFTEVEQLKGDVLTFGKLRASYAEVGQAGDYYASYYAVPTYNGGFSSGTPMVYPYDGLTSFTKYTILYDPELRPQNTKAIEIGTDLTFLQGWIDLSYTFSRQDVKDQIFEAPLAGSSGFSAMVTNGGKIHTNAHELTLNVIPFRKARLKWSFAFNFTKIDNYVDALKEGLESIFLGGFTDPQVRAGLHDKFPVIYGSSYLRNNAGQIVVNSSGMPQVGPEKVIGQVAPDFLLGFNTHLEYKKIRLAAVLDWKHGGQMYHGTAGLLDLYGVTQKSADWRTFGKFLFEEPAVKEMSTGKYEPNDLYIDAEMANDYFVAKNGISESSIFGTSFVKLRELSLGYPLFTSQKFKVDIHAFARNIILWSELKGFDPEVSQGNTNMSGAFERFSLPGTSSFGCAVKLNF